MDRVSLSVVSLYPLEWDRKYLPKGTILPNLYKRIIKIIIKRVLHPHVCKGYVFKCDSEACFTGLKMLLIARLTVDSKG